MQDLCELAPFLPRRMAKRYAKKLRTFSSRCQASSSSESEDLETVIRQMMAQVTKVIAVAMATQANLTELADVESGQAMAAVSEAVMVQTKLLEAHDALHEMV